MKRFLYILPLIAAVFACASCTKEVSTAVSEDEVTVSLAALLPSVMETKAIAKAENTDVVYYEVWDEEWSVRLFPAADGQTLSAGVTGKQAAIDLTLVRSKTYNMIFWAQDSSFDGYDVSDLRSVKVDYSKFEGNQDCYDAFYAVKKITVTGTFKETVYLRRPFAQLNFGATRMTSSLGPVVLGASEVKVSQLATSFDTREGVGEDVIENVRFVAEGNATDELLETEGKTYTWVSMNYMLMSGQKDAVTVTASFEEKSVDADVVHIVRNVPLQRNHRTNIIGDLFTGDAQLIVKVDPAFELPDEVLQL